MTRMSEEFQGGDAVLCMPRDLFKVAAHSAFSASLKKKPEEKRKAVQELRALLPPQSLYNHSSLSVPPATSSKILIVPRQSRLKSNFTATATAASSSTLSPDGITSRRWTFQIVASLRAKPCSLASDVIAAIDFDETGSRFATGGIARKIRICSYATLVSDHENSEAAWGDGAIGEDDFEEERQLLGPHGTGRSSRFPRSQCGRKRKTPETEGTMVWNHDQAALRIICTPAKLSSLKWRPLGSNVIGCGDYDGVVTEWDVEQGLCLSERYEHSGQRIWSVDYSSWFPTLCASASGDGTVRLWTLNCESSVGVIRSPGRNSICCAEFSSEEPHSVAVACADSNVYVYDVRRLDSFLLCLQGHERAASYVRFLGGEELVSASIDSTVKLWDVSDVASGKAEISNAVSCYSPDLAGEDQGRRRRSLKGSGGEWRLRKTFSAHKNVKNFVGLSVWKEGGLIACGSESDEVWVYESSSIEPVWCMKFPSHLRLGGHEAGRSCSAAEQKGAAVTGRVAPQEEEESSSRGSSGSFVGAVCWRKQGDHLALLSANSQGTVQLVKACLSG